MANGVVYVCTSFPGFGYGAGIYGFDATTGASLWSSQMGGDYIDTSPAVSNGMVYIGSNDNNLYAYALNGGNNSVYHRHTAPPKFSSLHPDLSLKPSN